MRKLSYYSDVRSDLTNSPLTVHPFTLSLLLLSKTLQTDTSPSFPSVINVIHPKRQQQQQIVPCLNSCKFVISLSRSSISNLWVLCLFLFVIPVKDFSLLGHLNLVSISKTKICLSLYKGIISLLRLLLMSSTTLTSVVSSFNPLKSRLLRIKKGFTPVNDSHYPSVNNVYGTIMVSLRLQFVGVRSQNGG